MSGEQQQLHFYILTTNTPSCHYCTLQIVTQEFGEINKKKSHQRNTNILILKSN